MRALAGAALVALAVAGCGSSRGGATASPSSTSASTCTSKPPGHAVATPTIPGNGAFSVVISQGQTIQRQATVIPQQEVFAVQVAWNKGDFQLTLTTASGKVYNRGTTDANANHHVEPNAESFSIHLPRRAGGRFSCLEPASLPPAS